MTRTSRITGVLPALLLGLLFAAQPAAAIFEVSTAGNVGVWQANDSLTAPGSKCEYNASSRLVRLSARPPVVFSYRSHGQTVGWRLKVVRNYELPNNPGQYADQLVYKSGFQRDFATLSNPADFTRKYWSVSGDTSSSTRYKVWVVIKWYRPSDGTSEGTVTFRYEWFKETSPSGNKTDQIYFCYRSYY